MSGRASKRQRRREAVSTARGTWEDDAFGIRVEGMSGGRARLTWTTDRDLSIAAMALERVRRVVSGLESEIVLGLRIEGESWDDIGFLLGKTGEAVRLAHGPTEAAYRAGGEV